MHLNGILAAGISSLQGFGVRSQDAVLFGAKMLCVSESGAKTQYNLEGTTATPMLRRAGHSLVQQVRSSSELPALTRALNYFDAPNGPAVKLETIENEWYNRQRPIMGILDRSPFFQACTWVAPNATVIGDVDIYDKVVIFFGAVLRGDLNKIRIGGNTAVLDRSVIHTAMSVPTGLNAATLIADYVTIEEGCVLRACRVEPKVIIGAKSVLCEGSIVETESILAPGTRTRVIQESAEYYVNIGHALRDETLPFGTGWKEVEDHRASMYMMRLQKEAENMDKLSH
eukprot:gene15921-22055_t